MRPRSIVFAVVALVLAVRVAAQDTRLPVPQPAVSIEIPPPDVTQELRLRDGSRLYGRVAAIDGDRVVFRTTAGADLTVGRADIASLQIAEGRIVKGEFFPSDPNATRLFFAPTGRSLPKGRGYFGVFEFLMPFVQVGITDRISVGAGTPLIFGFEDGRPFWVTPKIQLHDGRRVKVAAGLLHFFITGDEGRAGIAYGVATIGAGDSAATIGVGYAYARDDGDDHGDGRAIVAMVGGERRVSRRVKFMTENYMWDGGGLLSGGVRFLGERLSADVGLVVPLNAETFFAFPVVNFVWVF